MNMKKILPVFALFLFITSVSYDVTAQCKGFAKKICKSALSPYIHDGNYDAAILTEGEEADAYKTFYAGQQYRLYICSTESLPPIEFKVIDANRNVLFNNKDHDMVKYWDFTPESSQQLRIVIKVTTSGQKKVDTDIVSGCVAILVGFKDKDAK
jgi:hypothetical protein